LVSDYPNGVPADTVVVVAIGTADVIGTMNVGGIWSTNLSAWRLKHSEFTVPAVGATVTVQVAVTTGLAAGPNSLVVFLNGRNFTLFSVSAVNTQSSTLTLTSVSGKPGTLVSQNSSFEMAASYLLDFAVPIFTKGINALLADGASLVLALPQRTDILPLYNQGGPRVGLLHLALPLHQNGHGGFQETSLEF
jgi:hypothetical protein